MSYQHFIFGEFLNTDSPLNDNQINEIFARADIISGKIQQLPVDKIVEILNRTAEAWLDESFSYRQQVLSRMPPLIGYSEQMTSAALDALFTTMKRENLYRILRGHIGKSSFIDRFEYISSYNGYIKAMPLGTVLHVSPGNVFVGAVDSLIYGFLSKNVNLLKMSGKDPVFPMLFAESLLEIDKSETISGSYCLLNYSGSDKKIEESLKKRCDGIVVFGGEEAVKSYRGSLPLGSRLVEYGPKYSFSLITSEGFKNRDARTVYGRLALDIIMWEQRACSSPQVVYIEEDIIDEFMENLPEFLDEMDRRYPQQNISLDEKIEILKAREDARFDSALGKAKMTTPGEKEGWTVIYEKDQAYKTSPLNRTIYLKSFKSWTEVPAKLVNIKDYLQSAGVLASTAQMKLITKALAKIGVSRISRIGRMWKEKAGAPHDFDFPLRRLVKWVTVDWIEERFDLGEKVAPPKPASSRWERVRSLIDYARKHSEFYSKHFEGIELKKRNDYEEFQKVPLLTKEHIYENTPPQGEGILTGKVRNAYVFASGGSTGKPKFNYYSYRELDEVAAIMADIYQVAGINRYDVTANLFMAGSLWTSFIVVNDALEKIGGVSLPIAGNTDLETTLRYIELFKPTAIVGLPSMILRLAEEIDARKIDLKIEKILYGGEHFSPGAVKYLKESIGAEIIRSAGYASVDAGPIGYQCAKQTGGIHHLIYQYMLLEILDPETGEPVEDGQPGEIVVTNFHRRLMPIIRYRTGDLGRVIEQECECGHKTPQFELMGRCDDVLRIGAMSIYPNMFAEALEKVEGAGNVFQIVGDNEGAAERLTLHLESPVPEEERPALAEKTRTALIKHDPELELVLVEGWLKTLEVKILPPGGIERNERTGKIRRIVDKRNR